MNILRISNRSEETTRQMNTLPDAKINTELILVKRFGVQNKFCKMKISKAAEQPNSLRNERDLSSSSDFENIFCNMNMNDFLDRMSFTGGLAF